MTKRTEEQKQAQTEQTEQTRSLIENMVASLNDHSIDGQEKFWLSDAKWYGPAGAGTKPSLKAFQNGWQRPFLNAFPDKRATMDIFFAEGEYAVASGEVFATHKGEFMGLPGNNRPIRLRYMDFWRVESGKIAENWVLLDIIDFFRQHNIDLLRGKGWDQLGEGSQHNGSNETPTEAAINEPPISETPTGAPKETAINESPTEASMRAAKNKLDNNNGQGQRTRQVVIDMVAALNRHVIDGMEAFWTEDAKWRGPAGGGIKPSLKAFQDGWQRPFLNAFPDKGGTMDVFIADGKYAAATGVVIATHKGDFMGLPGHNKRITLRYMDIWEVVDDKIVDNWVLLDIIDFFRQHDIDLLEGKGWDDYL